jgi:hypothetical protein
MANPVRGELELNFGGAKRKFRLGMNEICTLERAYGVKMQNFVGQNSEKSCIFADMRDILYVGLHKYDPSITIEDVGEMMGECTDIEALTFQVMTSMAESNPGFNAGDRGESPLEAKKKENPPLQ